MASSLEVLFEDADIIAINKPAGLLSQQSHDPKRAHVLSLLENHFQSLGKKSKFFLHHRLDKDTSGVLLLGKSERANAPLTNIFREHQIQKTYWALSLHKENSRNILHDKTFHVEDHIAPVRASNKQLMRMVKVKKGGWRAETNFRCLQDFPGFFLIEAKPVTGRTHQIRVHLAGEKLPIAGDSLYGGKSSQVPRLMLHAKTLQFNHPITNTEITIEAPLPKDFESLLTKLNYKSSHPSQ